MVKCLPTMQETWVKSLGWEDLLEKEMVTTPVFLPGKSRGRRSLVGYSPCSHKELDMTERLHFHFPGDSEGRGSLACYSPWGHKELDTTKRLYNNDICISFHPKA